MSTAASKLDHLFSSPKMFLNEWPQDCISYTTPKPAACASTDAVASQSDYRSVLKNICDVVQPPEPLVNKKTPDNSLKRAANEPIKEDAFGVSHALNVFKETGQADDACNESAHSEAVPSSERLVPVHPTSSLKTPEVRSKKPFAKSPAVAKGEVWVQCSKFECQKWRKLRGVFDPSIVPDNWTCEMNKDTKYNNCATEEEECEEDLDDFVENKYAPGSLVWAKNTCLWWPGIVECDPDIGCSYTVDLESNKVAEYHITFFGARISKCWLKQEFILPFTNAEDPNNNLDPEGLAKMVKYAARLHLAKEQALKAVNLGIKERLTIYGFEGRQDIENVKSMVEKEAKSRKLESADGQPLNTIKRKRGRPFIHIGNAKDEVSTNSDRTTSNVIQNDSGLPKKRKLGRPVGKPKEKISPSPCFATLNTQSDSGFFEFLELSDRIDAEFDRLDEIETKLLTANRSSIVEGSPFYDFSGGLSAVDSSISSVLQKVIDSEMMDSAINSVLSKVRPSSAILVDAILKQKDIDTVVDSIFDHVMHKEQGTPSSFGDEDAVTAANCEPKLNLLPSLKPTAKTRKCNSKSMVAKKGPPNETDKIKCAHALATSHENEACMSNGAQDLPSDRKVTTESTNKRSFGKAGLGKTETSWAPKETGNKFVPAFAVRAAFVPPKIA